ncbi:MAG: hypothetical protein WA906_01020, partial [Pacificimonas sp.]
ADLVEEAPDLIASMLSAGRAEAALAWWPVLANADEIVRLRAWPMLVLADRGGAVPLTPGLLRNAYRVLAEDDSAEAARTKMRSLVSSLAGMRRISGRGWASSFDDFGVGERDDIHTQALDRAADMGRRGEVALLSSLGLQGGWGNVRSVDVRPILDAWSRVGLQAEARMLAVEAYMRGV